MRVTPYFIFLGIMVLASPLAAQDRVQVTASVNIVEGFSSDAHPTDASDDGLLGIAGWGTGDGEDGYLRSIERVAFDGEGSEARMPVELDEAGGIRLDDRSDADAVRVRRIIATDA